MRTDAPCPEPKPVTIMLLTVTGAAGGAVTGLINGKNDDFLTSSTLVGAGVGCTVGIGLAISSRLWLRLVVSSILSVPGLLAADNLWSIWKFGEVSHLSKYTLRDFGIFLLAMLPISCAMVLGHFLAMRRRKTWNVLPVYVAGGMFSAWPAWFSWTSLYTAHAGRYLPGAIVSGALFGVLQFLGMLAALAVDRRTRRGMEPSSGQEPA